MGPDPKELAADMKALTQLSEDLKTASGPARDRALRLLDIILALQSTQTQGQAFYDLRMYVWRQVATKWGAQMGFNDLKRLLRSMIGENYVVTYDEIYQKTHWLNSAHPVIVNALDSEKGDTDEHVG